MTENLSHIGPCPRSRSPCPELINCLAEGFVELGYFVPMTCLHCGRITYESTFRRETQMIGYRVESYVPPCFSENKQRDSITKNVCPQCRLERERGALP